MQKTKIEILNETAKAYTLSTRSVIITDGEPEQCVYLSPNGRKCALGRCLTDETLAKIVNDKLNIFCGSTSLNSEYGLDNILKDEYKGHDAFFWNDLQQFHDNPDYWNEEGLSFKGNNELDRLLVLYA